MTQGMNTQTERSHQVKLKLYVHCRLSIHMIINTLIKKTTKLKKPAPEDCKNVPCVTNEE